MPRPTPRLLPICLAAAFAAQAQEPAPPTWVLCPSPETLPVFKPGLDKAAVREGAATDTALKHQSVATLVVVQMQSGSTRGWGAHEGQSANDAVHTAPAAGRQQRRRRQGDLEKRRAWSKRWFCMHQTCSRHFAPCEPAENLSNTRYSTWRARALCAASPRLPSVVMCRLNDAEP